MPPKKKSTVDVQGSTITVVRQNEHDFISLTDIARHKDPERTDYLISNWLRNRNTVEFPGIWEQLNNPDFNPIEFDGIKKQSGLNSFILTAKQWITKTCAISIVSKAGRYGGTFAHKDIAFEFATWISVEFKLYLLNVALFGQTAKQWRTANPDAKGNIRDHAPIEQLVVLTNLESFILLLYEQPSRCREAVVL